MNRFVKSKAPSFLKVFERNDEKDDRRLLEMSTNSFGSLPTSNEKPQSDDNNNDETGGNNPSKSNQQEGERTGPGEDLDDEDKGLPKDPLHTEASDLPVGRQAAPSREFKEKQARSSTSAKGANHEGEHSGSKSATPNAGINGFVRSQSDRRLARTEAFTRNHSERSMGSEPSAYNAPPKPSFGPSSPYPASPPHRLTEVPVSIVKHAEACFSSPEKARKGSLFGRLRPKKDEVNNPHEQVEVAVAEVDGGVDSLPFAQLTLEAIGSKPEKPTVAAAEEVLDVDSVHEEPARLTAESSKALKNLNRDGGRGHDGRRPSTRELVRKKSGDRLNQPRNRATDSGRTVSRGANDDKTRRKSRNEETMRASRRRRSESMPRRRSVSRTRSGKTESKQKRIEAAGPSSKTERSPGSPNRSSTPTGREGTQVGETLEWRRNPRSASRGPAHSNSSPSQRSKPERKDDGKQDQLGRHEVLTTDSLAVTDTLDRTGNGKEKAKRPSPKRQNQASQSFSDDSSSSLRQESTHSTRGLLGTFLDQKRTFSEQALPKGGSEGSQNSKEFAGDLQGREGYREGRTRESSTDGINRMEIKRKKPLLQFPLDSEHTLFSTSGPKPNAAEPQRKPDNDGHCVSDADGGDSRGLPIRTKAKGIFESSILPQAPEASESGESEPELSGTPSRKHLARRSSRRRSSTTAVDATQPPTPKRLPRRATTTGIAPASTGRVRKFLSLPRSDQKVSDSLPSLPVDDNAVPESKRSSLNKAPSAILEVASDSDSSESSDSDDNMTSPTADTSRDVPAPVSYTFAEIPFLTISKDIVEIAERSSSSKLNFSYAETNESKHLDVRPNNEIAGAPTHQEVFIVGRKNGIHDERTSDEYSQLSFELAQSRIRLRETRMEVDQIELDILMLQERLLILDQRKETSNVSLFA